MAPTRVRAWREATAPPQPGARCDRPRSRLTRAVARCVGGCAGSGWDVCGVSAATKDSGLVRKSSVTQGNGGDWAASAGTDLSKCRFCVGKVRSAKPAAGAATLYIEEIDVGEGAPRQVVSGLAGKVPLEELTGMRLTAGGLVPYVADSKESTMDPKQMTDLVPVMRRFLANSEQGLRPARAEQQEVHAHRVHRLHAPVLARPALPVQGEAL